MLACVTCTAPVVSAKLSAPFLCVRSPMLNVSSPLRLKPHIVAHVSCTRTPHCSHAHPFLSLPVYSSVPLLINCQAICPPSSLVSPQTPRCSISCTKTPAAMLLTLLSVCALCPLLPQIMPETHAGQVVDLNWGIPSEMRQGRLVPLAPGGEGGAGAGQEGNMAHGRKSRGGDGRRRQQH